ncbi:MAG: hypothetical protein IH898_11465 [Planctomycetes bacterium]|nr:hypothetical protein [Planctomycetota bacterium]
MSVRSAPPPRAFLVYTLLIIAGVLAAVIGAITVGVIVYNYVTREELRNPPPLEEEGERARLPDWIVRI